MRFRSCTLVNLVATALEKMNMPHDSSCYEGSKNVWFVHVRNLEGQNHPEHTVKVNIKVNLDIFWTQRLYSSLKQQSKLRLLFFVLRKNFSALSWCQMALICLSIVAKAFLWSRETIFLKFYLPQHPPILFKIAAVRL